VRQARRNRGACHREAPLELADFLPRFRFRAATRRIDRHIERQFAGET